MKFSYTAIWFGVCITRIAATASKNCANTCFNTLSSIKFADIDPSATYFAGLCNSSLLITSTYSCFATYCAQYSVSDSWDDLKKDCEKDGGVELPNYIDTISRIDLSAVPIIQVLKMTSTINRTVVPDKPYFDVSLKTLTTWNFEKHIPHVYGWCIYFLAAWVLLLGVTNRVFALVFHNKSMQQQVKNIEGTSSGRSKIRLVDKVNNIIHKHIILPATFGYRHVQPLGWCTIPTRIQSILLFAFVALNVVFSCVDYRIFAGNTYFPKTSYQLARYIADRTGTMSFVNLPLMFLFAGRNNLLLWTTGWSYKTFNIFHRYIARIVTLQAIVHSIAYTVCFYLDWSEYKDAWKDQYFYCGGIATVAMSFIIACSILPIRQRAYEFFLAFHVSFSVIVMVTLFYHVKIFLGKQDPYLWVCVGFWGFDRFIRLVRMILLNYRFFIGRSKATQATASYDPASDIIRLRVCPPTRFAVAPGMHYYIYTPTLSFKFWENHPFTLASWTNHTDNGIASAVSGRTSTLNELLDEKNMARPSSMSRNNDISNISCCEELLFIVRPYKGMTNDLKKRILKNSGYPTNVPVFVEGPYGTSQSLQSYKRILLISGGSGITATLPYLKGYGLSGQHYIRFVCTVREQKFLDSLINDELAPFINKENIRMNLHLTRDAKGAVHGIVSGRPNVSSLLEEEVTELELHGKGKLAVIVCGPARLADDVRREVVRIIGNRVDASQILLHEEAFGW